MEAILALEDGTWFKGAAAGAGLSLALACDLRVVGETAKITTAFAKVGLSGDYGGTYYLTKLIGSARARELYLLSPILSGKEAQAIGMMTRCVPDADVVKSATELAMQLAKGPTITLGYIKRNINNAEKFAIEACFDGRSRRRGSRLTFSASSPSSALAMSASPFFSMATRVVVSGTLFMTSRLTCGVLRQYPV